MSKASAKQAKNNSPETNNLTGRILREGALIGLVCACVLMLITLVTYDTGDPGWSRTGENLHVQNAGGPAGAWFADVCFTLFGYLAFLFPLMLGYRAWLVFRDRSHPPQFDPVLIGLRTVGLVLVMVAGTGLAVLHVGGNGGALPFSDGGYLGLSVAEAVAGAFSHTGGTLLLFAVFFFGVTIFTDLSWLGLMDRIGLWVLTGSRKLAEKWTHWRQHRAEQYEANKQQRERKAAIVTRKKEEAKRVPPKITEPARKPAPVKRPPPAKQASLFEKTDAPVGEMPAIELLDPADKHSDKAFSKESLEAMSKLLELKLKDFGIEIEVTSVQPGPVVTRFEIKPAPGVKASRITNLAKDLARSLAVISVRVVEVIPGKSVMGIEIPNEHREMVRLSEVIASEPYDRSKSRLTMALGHNIAGEPVIADLAKMPHLLVAGTTGSGKSVGVNVMLLSLLYKSSPKDVRLILVDPKMLELSVYEGIPHLLTPVITDMNDASNGLRWCVGEMERRYKLMAAMGVRNLAGFNRKVSEAEKAGTPIADPLFKPDENFEAGSAEATPPNLETLPAIVVVIDEFADMMMIVGKKVEQLIARIAQKARAAGIHLILATQRPSVDVITGLIKANVPTRMAFQVSSKIDSRTILDQGGAEQLLGHGDMLYLPPGTSVPERVHGAFVDDHEVHNVVSDWKKRGQPNYLEEVVDDSTNSIPVPGLPGGEEGSNDEGDALYDEAVAFVIDSRKASISGVQRKLRIGYNRAARLIETMEAAGVVSGAGHNGNREVLAPKG
ncbi:DNA translocase FtsK 4TM domain-containing protein [Gilvimarinus agarilyticus]|uniref:DNA translocase FtsK n=1 Tax=unclassified Gilvimarinus TaxID=2642066 RepID=UPI001C081FB6|nr:MULTISPECIES: DNA translocase FtsK [unclassified Gilvimarinus]MBU2886428.1 DNA translocase FtsK 4TM domain-containing protein [Gilvimarinus agarilyticus]MDO6571107.1 DNA translocase FtsK 4TM domain-containing protein [Gilvimarinus sp. 2_MG-2023]MDO6745651.1 DNA translocase FtsK 4TM domain-containing protein [Gilvimarinus sp. 1_MG-2023]